MGKKQNEFSSFKTRSGSHSMTAHSNGSPEALPLHCQELENIYLNFMEQYQVLKEEALKYQQSLKILKPHDDINAYEMARKLLSDTNSKIQNMKKVIIEAANKSYAEVFYDLSRYLIPTNLFKAVDLQVEILLNRCRKPDEFKEVRNIRSEAYRKRKNLRKYLERNGLE